MDIRYLTIQEIAAINVAMIKKYSPDEPVGILNPPLLDSAVYRPQQSAFSEDAYSGIFEKAAALFELLGQNHSFQNANKRTAFTSMVIFLRYNGYKFSMKAKQAEEFTVAMVKHEYEFQQLVDIIKNSSAEIPT